MEGLCNQCVFLERLGICPTDTSLVYAASKLKELIAAGTDVNATCECHGSGTSVSATWNKRNGCLKEVIQAGADVNIINKTGKTILMFDAAKCHVECLKEPIAAGANSNNKDNNGQTDLMQVAGKAILNV